MDQTVSGKNSYFCFIFHLFHPQLKKLNAGRFELGDVGAAETQCLQGSGSGLSKRLEDDRYARGGLAISTSNAFAVKRQLTNDLSYTTSLTT